MVKNNIIKRKLFDKKAQALPEFALCLPLIMLMIGMLITIGQLIYAKEVLQAASQAACRAYVSNYQNPRDAERKAITFADAIMDTASMNIMIKAPTGGSGYVFTPPTVISRGIYTNAADDPSHVSRPLETAKGVAYKYVGVTVYGAIETLFPVQWNGNSLTPNTTFLEAYCAMVIEE